MTLDLNNLRESTDCEFKLAEGRDGQGEVPRDFWKTYSAMANTNGGIIVLGVRELKKESKFVINGIKNVDFVIKSLWDILNNQSKVNVNILTNDSIVEETIDEKSVLIITIPRCDRNLKPIYIDNNPKMGTYIRRHEGDYLAQEDELKRLISDADISQPWDLKIVNGFKLNDLDFDAIKAYKNLLRTKNANHVFLQYDDLNFLRQIGAIARNSDEITNAGLVFFGNHAALTHGLPFFSLDYREIPKESSVTGIRWVDRVFSDGSWSGNIFNFYFKVQPKLIADLKVPFKLGADLSRVDDTPIHYALREAFVNTLVHADYTGRVGIRVFKHRDRFEFINFGTFLFPPEEAQKGGKSECRNPTIQKMMALIGIGEKAGSGLTTILQTWKDQHWRRPLLEEKFDSNETRLELQMISLYPDEIINELSSTFGNAFTELNKEERLALIIAKSEFILTNRRLQEVSDSHSRDLTFLLKGLVEKHFLVPHDRGTARSYTLSSGFNPESGSGLNPEPDLELDHIESAHNTIELSGDVNVFSEMMLNSAVSKIRAEKRSKPEEVKKVILELCKIEKTLDELASELNRNKDTLRKDYISSMVSNEELFLKYPDSVNHPEQAYRAKKY